MILHAQRFYHESGNFRRVLIFVDGMCDKILTDENLDAKNKKYTNFIYTWPGGNCNRQNFE